MNKVGSVFQHTTKSLLRLYSPLRYVACEPKPICNFDCVLVGGGIVGLATARELLYRYPSMKLALVEKEAKLAQHQSTRHPGLIHSGIFCEPDTQQAYYCIKGSKLLQEWCKDKMIPILRCGKLIVAVNDADDEHLQRLICNSVENKIQDVKILSSQLIKAVEPRVEGVRAIHLPCVGTVCWDAVARSFADDIRNRKGKIYTGFRVSGFSLNWKNDEVERKKYPVCVYGPGNSINASFVIVCAGIYADKLAQKSGCSNEPMIFTMRTNYLQLQQKYFDFFRGNVYVPNPIFPFLGPNVTRRADGSVWLGPNVIPALKRGGYGKSDISVKYVKEMLHYRGYWSMQPRPMKRWINGILTEKSVQKQLKPFQMFAPCLTEQHVVRSPYSMVYPQAVDTCGYYCRGLVLQIAPPSGATGVISRRVLHVRCMPQPAATSCMAIAKEIANKVQIDFLRKPLF